MTRKENTEDKQSLTVDLFMFMGQSNMAGRGIVDKVHTEACQHLRKGRDMNTAPCPPPAVCTPYPSPLAGGRTAKGELTTKL